MASNSDANERNDVALSDSLADDGNDAVSSDSFADDRNDAVSSDPLTEKTTTTQRQRLNSSTGTLTFEDPVHATQLPTLPFETVVEILSRLPVKFLMQFQSVCKSWKSLISDPKFAKKHLRVSTTRYHLLLTNSSHEFFFTAYPFSSVFTEVTATLLEYPLNNPNHFAQIVDSCHGILCFSVEQRFVLLWNPSIRKFSKLPDNPKRKGSCTLYGFGYTQFSDSYKAVAVSSYCEPDGSYKTQVKVLTLGTSAWRRIPDFPSGLHFYNSGKFVSGAVSWLASRYTYSSCVIVSLDLEKESYQEFLQPDDGGVLSRILSLGVLRDCLCVLSVTDTFTDIWLMQEYGNKGSWTTLFRLPNMGVVGSCPFTKAVYVSEDDKVLLKCQPGLVVYNTRDDDKVLLECQSGLVVYNARDGTFKTPQIQNINGWTVPEIYQESLISPCF